MRHSHSKAFQLPSASIEAYKCSFFPQTIRDWNDLPDSLFSTALSLTGSASRTDLSQLANGIWEIHAGCPSFLRVSYVAKIGYIPQFKASNARDQDEVSSDLARMFSTAEMSDDCVSKFASLVRSRD